MLELRSTLADDHGFELKYPYEGVVLLIYWCGRRWCRRRKLPVVAAIINTLPFFEGYVLFLLQRVRVVMSRLCLWRKKGADRVVWSLSRKEKSEDGASSPMFCSCKQGKNKGS
ncbi:hypothetical protein NC652_002356 [Populus alba x Populus x berolinensis]|nr:hypothetical protein NC652_002356 [Populus alba x Populus x berolinensis]